MPEVEFLAELRLKHQFQTELNLSPNRGALGELAEVWTSHGKGSTAGARQKESGCIRQIEDLHPKLQSGCLCDGGVLKERKVKVRRTRASAHVPGRITEALNLGAGYARNRAWHA